MRRLPCACLLLALAPSIAPTETPLTEKVFGGAQIEEIFRVRLDRDDLLLESIREVIKLNGIEDGALLTAAGSLQECTFHGVTSFAAQPEQHFTTKKQAM